MPLTNIGEKLSKEKTVKQGIDKKLNLSFVCGIIKFLKNYILYNFDRLLTSLKKKSSVLFGCNLLVFFRAQEHLIHHIKMGTYNIPLPF